MGRFNSKLNTDEDKIINLKGKSEEYILIESWRDKKKWGKRWRIKNIVTCFNVYLKYKKKGTEQTRGANKREKIFEVITTENFPKLSKVDSSVCRKPESFKKST